jgi:hypothetical protein
MLSSIVALTVPALIGSSSTAATFKSATVNPYCESMIANHPSPPTNDDPTMYHAWAKANLKYFEHLQHEANTSTAKSSLRLLVPILKVEAKSSNMKTLGSYVTSEQVTWAREWQDFDKTVVLCAKWAVDLL